MCTVTIVPSWSHWTDGARTVPASVRIACNRDELLARPAAFPPQVHEIDGISVAMPIDLATGGTC